jgi:hypothetical protein
VDNSGTAPERFEGGGNPIRHRKRGGVEGGRGFLGAAIGARFPAQRRNGDAGQRESSMFILKHEEGHESRIWIPDFSDPKLKLMKRTESGSRPYQRIPG